MATDLEAMGDWRVWIRGNPEVEGDRMTGGGGTWWRRRRLVQAMSNGAVDPRRGLRGEQGSRGVECFRRKGRWIWLVGWESEDDLG